MNQRILLVEDEETLRDAIKLNLELEGYEVEEADTGTKALKKTQEQRFNLIILDVMLPEMDGFTVCQKMRMNDTETPVIFLTAKDSSQDKVAAVAYKFPVCNDPVLGYQSYYRET